MTPRMRASITPAVGTAGEYGTWTVRCTVEGGQLETGETIAVALPNTWHAWLRNSAKGVHSIDPTSPNYVSASASRGEVEVHCTVPDGSTDEYEKRTRDALVGPPNRCAYHTEVTVLCGVLQAGDWIDIIYGDTSGGSPGFRAALHPNGPETVRVVLMSADGAREKTLLREEESPLLVTSAAELVEIAAYAPSHTRVGSEAVCHIVALDKWQNAATAAQLTFAVSVLEGRAEHPAAVALNPETGTCVVPFTPTAPGVLRLEVSATPVSHVPFDKLRACPVRDTGANGKDGLRASGEERHGTNIDKTLAAVSNPILCADELPAEQVYWGDLHSHARRSFDATGDLPFHYARDVAHLDFYALTDHVEGLTDEMWQEIRLATQDWYDPGRFATILGYEATFPAPWAHHNVYFRDDGDVRIGGHNGTVQDLWQQLAAGEAMTIPHHTGVRFSPKASNVPGGTGPNIDWQYANDAFRRVVEVYSGHGLCEYYDPAHPLAYQHCDFSLNDSAQGPHYVQDGWLTGQRMGTICSSDNHQAQPGRRQTGLAAVWAPALTRSGIFDSIHHRRTYGTTGARILLKVWVNDTFMGQETASGDGVSVRVWVVGTAEIAWVEILRGDLDAQRFDVVYRREPQATIVAFTWDDPQPVANALYYVRLRQQELVAGRVAQAWSSPVWVVQAKETAS
ncbi:MAG: DUF3604 domain-containing protein [Chloroflexota bacterium]|nr:DUF3604 domain-containing protein [Chloroflexota bacterium]